VIVFDPEGLNLIDNESQSRKKPPLLMEVVNRTIDIKNGSASFELVASGFNIDARFGLVSPSSKIVNVTGPKTFVITFIYVASPYGPSEFRKWNRLINPAVRIRRPDFSQVFNTVLVSANSNTVEIRDVPPFSLQPNDIMEFSDYSFVDTKQQQKLIYAFATDDENDFPDGGKYYGLI
jgi:hypothetical protein